MKKIHLSKIGSIAGQSLHVGTEYLSENVQKLKNFNFASF